MTDQVRKIIIDSIDKLGYILYDMEFKQEGNDWYLRVFVDNEDHSINIEDCIKLNSLLCEGITDDMITQEYFLEVSSPGAERELRSIEEMNEYLESYVLIKTYEKIDGMKEFYGYLVSAVDNKVTIKTPKKELIFDLDKVSKIRLAIKF